MEQKLAEELKSAPISLAFEFLSGEIDLCTRGPPIVPLAPMTLHPRNSDSIGRPGDDSEAGTLGGWLMLKYPNNKQVKCAMTCFHVVAGQNIPNSSVLVTKAIDASTSNNRIEVEHPAAYGRKFAIQVQKSRLQSELDPEKQLDSRKELDTLEQRDKSPVIGTVIYGSGVRTNEAGRRMDWALIETPSTYSVNVPARASSFSAQASRHPENSRFPIFYRADASSQVRAIGKLGLSDWVLKRGRTSVDTSGEVNKLPRVIKWKDCDSCITQEIEVLGLGPNWNFAEPGDLGAFVTNERRELGGMVIGRDPYASDYGLGFITDIREIEQDVTATCGATFASFPAETIENLHWDTEVQHMVDLSRTIESGDFRIELQSQCRLRSLSSRGLAQHGSRLSLIDYLAYEVPCSRPWNP